MEAIFAEMRPWCCTYTPSAPTSTWCRGQEQHVLLAVAPRPRLASHADRASGDEPSDCTADASAWTRGRSFEKMSEGGQEKETITPRPSPAAPVPVSTSNGAHPLFLLHALIRPWEFPRRSPPCCKKAPASSPSYKYLSATNMDMR